MEGEEDLEKRINRLIVIEYQKGIKIFVEK
jgi:hypothetical protein